jgi:hypothetical protein
MSLMLERVMAHLQVGAQKNIVIGPAGCANNDLRGKGINGVASNAACNAGTKLMVM